MRLSDSETQPNGARFHIADVGAGLNAGGKSLYAGVTRRQEFE